jgi:hypothetical protein
VGAAGAVAVINELEHGVHILDGAAQLGLGLGIV